MQKGNNDDLSDVDVDVDIAVIVVVLPVVATILSLALSLLTDCPVLLTVRQTELTGGQAGSGSSC